MECKKTRDLCNELKKLNAVVLAIVAHTKQEPGWPDRYICHTRWHGWIEFKDVHTRLAPLQRIRIRELRKRGDNAWVVRFPDRIEDHEGRLHATFDGTAVGLLQVLGDLRDAGTAGSD